MHLGLPHSGLAGCLTALGSQGAFGILVMLYFLTGSGNLVGCCLPQGYLLSPVGYIWEVVLWLESQKLGISIPLSSPVIAGEAGEVLWVLVLSAWKYTELVAEVPSDGP